MIPTSIHFLRNLHSCPRRGQGGRNACQTYQFFCDCSISLIMSCSMLANFSEITSEIWNLWTWNFGKNDLENLEKNWNLKIQNWSTPWLKFRETSAITSEDTLSGVSFSELIGRQLTPSGTATGDANDKPTWANFFTWLLDPIVVGKNLTEKPQTYTIASEWFRVVWASVT